mgnify:CR=1 FL=1
MPVPMNKTDIEFTIQTMRDRNDATHNAHYDRVIERMCNYVEANVDDFMECYEAVDRGMLLDTDSLSDILGGGQG